MVLYGCIAIQRCMGLYGCMAPGGRRDDAWPPYGAKYRKLKSGPRRQFGPRRAPGQFACCHRVIAPTEPQENTHLYLGLSWGRTVYVAHFSVLRSYSHTSYSPCHAPRVWWLYSIHPYSLKQSHAPYSHTPHTAIHPIHRPSDNCPGELTTNRISTTNSAPGKHVCP